MSTTNNQNFFALIDKPIGITSFDLIRQLRKKENIRKMWHTGTLDPLATGLMLVAFWSYTKLIPYFEKDTKTYEFELSLEGTTASLDAEEELIPAPQKSFLEAKDILSEERILDILTENFTGEIEQIPPKYSALKIDGKRAVDRVRAWEDVEIKKRRITIYSIDLLNFSFPKITLQAKVSAGTYIRTIAWDFGDIMGTWAYVTKLRRTEIWNLDLTHSHSLETFSQEDSLKPELLFPKHNFLQLSDDIIDRLSHGQRVRNTDKISAWEYFLEKNWFITHVIEVDDYLLRQKRKI